MRDLYVCVVCVIFREMFVIVLLFFFFLLIVLFLFDVVCVLIVVWFEIVCFIVLCFVVVVLNLLCVWGIVICVVLCVFVDDWCVVCVRWGMVKVLVFMSIIFVGFVCLWVVWCVCVCLFDEIVWFFSAVSFIVVERASRVLF